MPESYLYQQLRASDLFDDVCVSTLVSWDDISGNEDTETRNEIDLIGTCGIQQVFISCKSNLPQPAALNELATLTERLGTCYTTPILATTHDLQLEAPAVYNRALDMEITVLDMHDLDPERLMLRLRQILSLPPEA